MKLNAYSSEAICVAIILTWCMFTPVLFIGFAYEQDDKFTAAKVVAALEQHLRKRISNPVDPKALHIKIVQSPSQEETAKGKFQLVEIRSSPVRIKTVNLLKFEALVIEPVVDAKMLVEDDKLVVLSVKESHCDAIFTPQSFEQIFAEGKYTKNMNIKVKFRDDNQVELTGRWTLFGINNPFRAVGKFLPAQDGSVHVRFSELYFNAVPVPEWLQRRLEGRLNPLLKPDDMIFDPIIRSVVIEGDRMLVSTKPLKPAQGK
ncbi:MAG: hypothetical protein RMK18_10770 [Armatimonadota bacterium]|nr:hypothetical protein [Armatimonadota bacterium]MCX7776690.1 hypothetical protein [Armatimonadota bacterium]MDW8026328.1 hypothetical protein [Armatimonadota bacterium]